MQQVRLNVNQLYLLERLKKNQLYLLQYLLEHRDADNCFVTPLIDIAPEVSTLYHNREKSIYNDAIMLSSRHILKRLPIKAGYMLSPTLFPLEFDSEVYELWDWLNNQKKVSSKVVP